VVRNGQPLEAVEVTTPEPTGTQVLLKTTYCGVCHSDLYFQDGYYDLGGGKRLSLKDRGVKLPFIPGHETVGKVVALGPEAKGVAVGDHRLVYPWAGCGKCKHCLSGNDHMCLTPRSLGVFRDGGYGTHVLVDKPEHLVDFGNVDPALAATYACSGITAYSAVRKLSDVEPDSPVVVIGAGGLVSRPSASSWRSDTRTSLPLTSATKASGGARSWRAFGRQREVGRPRRRTRQGRGQADLRRGGLRRVVRYRESRRRRAGARRHLCPGRPLWR